MAEPGVLERPAISYPPDAILTQRQVAGWLGLSVRTVRKLPIKRWGHGSRIVRYLGKHVLEYIEAEST